MVNQRTRDKAGPVVNAALLLGALNFLGFGVWAFFWPENFFHNVASFPPFNLHLFHDAGAFQLGIGAALLGAVFWRDGLLVALFGAATGAVVHAISHVTDRELGGSASDPWVLGALAVLLVVAAVLRAFSVRSARSRTVDP